MARRFKGKPVLDKNEMDIGRVSDALCSWTAACLQRRRTRHSRIIQKRHSAAPCRFYDDNISTVRHSCFYSFRRFEDKISSCWAENREYGMISWKIEGKNHFIFSTRASFDIITPIWYWRVVYGFDIYFIHFSTLLVFIRIFFFVKLNFSREIRENNLVFFECNPLFCDF